MIALTGTGNWIGGLGFCLVVLSDLFTVNMNFSFSGKLCPQLECLMSIVYVCVYVYTPCICTVVLLLCTSAVLAKAVGAVKL